MACKWSKNDDAVVADVNKRVKIFPVTGAGVINGETSRADGSVDFTDVAVRPTTATPIKVVASGGNNAQADSSYFFNSGGTQT